MRIRRNASRADLYKSVINECCNPGCGGESFCLHVHHVIPLSQDGCDGFINYICLCPNCHLSGENHTYLNDATMTKLLTWKFRKELAILGTASDDHTDAEFRDVLWAHLKAQDAMSLPISTISQSETIDIEPKTRVSIENHGEV